MSIKLIMRLATAIVLAASVAGCDRGDRDQTPVEEVIEEVVDTVDETPELVEEPEEPDPTLQ